MFVVSARGKSQPERVAQKGGNSQTESPEVRRTGRTRAMSVLVDPCPISHPGDARSVAASNKMPLVPVMRSLITVARTETPTNPTRDTMYHRGTMERRCE